MRKLSRFFRGHWHKVILAPTFKLIEAVIELIVPILVADIIDIGISGGDTRYVWIHGGLMIGLTLLGFGFSALCQYLASRAGQTFATNVRAAMLRHVNTLSYADLDGISASSLTARMTGDVNNVQQGVSMAMRLLTRSPFLIIGATVGAMIISPLVSVIFVGVAAVIGVATYFIMSKSTPFYRRAAAQTDRVASLAREDLSGARVIRAYAKEKEETSRAAKDINELSRYQRNANIISALLNPVAVLVVNIGVIAVLAWGGILTQSGALTAGKIVALINYLTQIQLSLLVLANLLIIFTRTAASAARINEVFELSNTLPQATQDAEFTRTDPAIEFRDVTFGYHRNAQPVVENVSVSVPRGGMLGIIGGTGSGKSTLIQLLQHFYEADSGEVLLYGRNVKDYPPAQLLKILGYVPQKAVLLSGSVRDNLLWRKRDASDEELYAALSAAQADFVSKESDGLNRSVSPNGRNFSGGQRQRLTVARALVGSPEILILDDSTSALDAATDARLRAAVKKAGLTTVLISQRVGSLMQCDSILVLDQGDQVGYGTHAELLRDCPLYREIYEGQLAATGGKR